ncbi:hypothetical protein L596_011307 [Steinernema carpocapsae]|uniref:Uncharacterized protein n=1 Tax=Steinernema carpocapsae TaxID=34508 RepID=A0A4U5NTG3_STECR|nr:hypothetical protein L596_011307 [Steinernema carpocapsae]
MWEIELLRRRPYKAQDLVGTCQIWRVLSCDFLRFVTQKRNFEFPATSSDITAERPTVSSLPLALYSLVQTPPPLMDIALCAGVLQHSTDSGATR